MLVIILDYSRYSTPDAYTTYTPDASTAYSMDASGAQRSDGLVEQMTGRTGGGLRHRRKEKRGVAYNRYDPVSNGTQWQGMVYLVEYIMEYNRGASAICVHRTKKIQEVFAFLRKNCYITERAGTFPCTRYRTTGTENSSQDMTPYLE